LDNEEYIEIKNAAIIEPDSSLKKINIKLNRLFIKEYPGGKSHTILFNFYTENKIEKIDRKEKVHFNQIYQIQNEGSAPIDGVQIFNNLNLDQMGLIFKFTSINVKDEKDQTFLKTLNSNTIKMGIGLLSIIQPAISIIAEFVINIGRAILNNRNKNRRVQEYEFGLYLDNSSDTYKLSKGSYVIVQVPEGTIWDWGQWIYVPHLRRILRKSEYSSKKEVIPFNYFVLGVD